MKRFVPMALLALSIAAGARAQTPGHLGLYSDATGSDCQVSETYPGIYQVYVIHKPADGVEAVAFSVPVPICASVSWLADNSDFPVKIGFSPSGVNVVYQGCRAWPTVVMTILYVGSQSQDCCPLAIEASTRPGDPPYPAVILCPCTPDFPVCAIEPVTVSPAYFNANATCVCSVPAQETTWGRLKATYGE